MLGGRSVWIGLGISAVLLALFLLTVDVPRMVDELARARYVWVVPAIAVYLVGVWCRAWRWQVLLRPMRSVPVARLFPVVVVGYMANNLLPMRLGELVRSYQVGEREGVSKTSALATILVERVLDALVLLAFVAAFFVPARDVAAEFGAQRGVPGALVATALSLPFLALFGAVMVLALFPERGNRLVAAVLSPLPSRARAPLAGMVELFLGGFAALRSARGLVGLFALSLPIWLLEAMLFLLIGLSFGLDDAVGGVPRLMVVVLLVTAVANLASSVPAAPGGIGLFELAARETLVLLPMSAVDRAVAGGYVAVVHAALLLPMIVLGQVFLWTEHLSLGRLSRAGRGVSRGESE